MVVCMPIEYIKKYLQTKYHNSSDLIIRELKVNNKKVLYVFLESVSSDDKISNFLMKSINLFINSSKKTNNLFKYLENTLSNSHLIISNDISDIFSKLGSGFTCLFIDGKNEYICVETKASLDRGVVESTSEAIIRGPKDSFTENIAINMGLLRKRIKDPNLFLDEVTIGKRTKTKVIIAYINNISLKKNIKKIKNKLNNINIDGILDSGYIRDFLTNSKSFFPKIKSTERPDLACMELLVGKIIIMVDNSPFVLILPSFLTDYITNPEDIYQKTSNVNYTRILRFIAFILTIITPGIYIAFTTFNQEVIPDELLISLASQREGVPFPTAVEALIMMLTFEILRESDIRLPSKMGAAISIVGALVLGEAAVAAGIVAPIVIIVIAITSICGLLFTDIDFVNAIRWWRLIFLLFGSIIGIFGIVIAGIIFINKLSSITTFDIPYLTPISPLYKDIKNTLLKIPINKQKYRPVYLTKNKKR